MGLLEGQDLTLIKGDVDTLKDDLRNHILATVAEHDGIHTDINMIREYMRYLESYLESVDKRLKNIELKIRGKY